MYWSLCLLLCLCKRVAYLTPWREAIAQMGKFSRLQSAQHRSMLVQQDIVLSGFESVMDSWQLSCAGRQILHQMRQTATKLPQESGFSPTCSNSFLWLRCAFFAQASDSCRGSSWLSSTLCSRFGGQLYRRQAGARKICRILQEGRHV